MPLTPSLPRTIAATLRRALPMLLTLGLAACGGGDPGPDAAAGRATAAAERTAGALTAEDVMRWAQHTYPALFPDSPPLVTVPHEGRTYRVRSYAGGNHLGVSEGRIYGLGPFTQGVLTDFGALADHAPAVCALLGCGASGPEAGAVDTRVRVLPPTPAAITATVLQGAALQARWSQFSGRVEGDVATLAGRTLYVVVEDPSSLYRREASLQLQQDGAGWRYTLLLQPQPLATVGRHTGTLRVFACLDAQCGTRLAGTPAAIAYDVTVAGSFQASSTRVALTVPYGTVPADQTVVLSAHPLVQQAFSWSVAYPDDGAGRPALASLLSLRSQGSLPAVDGRTTVQLRFHAAPPGRYQGRLRLVADLLLTDGSRAPQAFQDIDVDVTVTGSDAVLALNPASLSLSAPQGAAGEAFTVVQATHVNHYNAATLQATEYLGHPAAEGNAALHGAWLKLRYQVGAAGQDLLVVEAWACPRASAGGASLGCLKPGLYTAQARLRVSGPVDPDQLSLGFFSRDVLLPISFTVRP